MMRQSARMIALWIQLFGLLLITSVFAHSPKNFPGEIESCGGLRLIKEDAFTRIGPPQLFFKKQAATANFVVNYHGFPPAAQAAFQRAVDIWSSLLSSTVPIRVDAEWTSLGENVLGAAGAKEVFANFSGAPQELTWYPVALAEKLARQSLNNSADPDIAAQFNSDRDDWYFGLDGNTPAREVDFVTVVLHELGHGLGFQGTFDWLDNSGSWGIESGGNPPLLPIIFDGFAFNNEGQNLIDTGIFPNPSTLLGTQLTGDNLFFDGLNANGANNRKPPKLYAPRTWESGSSFSHLDELTFPIGDPNSLMTPSIRTAEAIHSPGEITLGIFIDIGWTVLTDIEPLLAEVPREFTLYQNYPNPFNPSTQIEFYLPRTEAVSLTIYNVLGQKIVTLINETRTAGRHALVWDGTDAAGRPVGSGIYLYVLDTGSRKITKKMALIR